MCPSRTGSCIPPKELAGLGKTWMECGKENQDTETCGCFLKKTPRVGGGWGGERINQNLTTVRDLQKMHHQKYLTLPEYPQEP